MLGFTQGHSVAAWEVEERFFFVDEQKNKNR